MLYVKQNVCRIIPIFSFDLLLISLNVVVFVITFYYLFLKQISNLQQNFEIFFFKFRNNIFRIF